MSKGQQTRQRIVAEAATLFNQHGFEGSSLGDLMEATGLEKGGIYRHFSSKEEVAAEAFDYAWRAASDARLHDLDTVLNSVDRLKKFVSNFVERRGPVAGGCPLLNTAIDTDDGNPVLRQRARKALREWIERLALVVKSGIKAGEIHPVIDPQKVAILLVSSLEGALMMSRLERDQKPLLAIQSYLNAYLEKDVRTGSRKSRAIKSRGDPAIGK